MGVFVIWLVSKPKAIKSHEMQRESETSENDADAPKWIKIFQERSDKLKLQKEKYQNDVPIIDNVQELSDNVRLRAPGTDVPPAPGSLSGLQH